MGHGSQVINFSRADVCNDGNEIRGIAKIPIVKEKLNSSIVTVLIDMINATSIEGGRAANNSMYLFKFKIVNYLYIYKFSICGHE